ncbi:MAG: hypothetical protein CVU77_00270 [Elusimicrobia bacterium HGW-Elusimicrobia-1]|nr:MAG: hypothetical protein CVU77_00270 [Elusimicrobia bacterium HGW-Elusimicrobia-1]
MAVEPTSLRIKGMGGGLGRIVADEYTDFLAVPSDVLKVNGSRLYSNLSNLSNASNSGETLFANGSVNQYLIGGLTRLPVGTGFGSVETFGALAPQNLRRYINFNTALVGLDPTAPAEAATYMLFGAGEGSQINDGRANVPADYEKETAKASQNTPTTLVNAIYGYGLSDDMKLGVRLSYSDVVNEISKEHTDSEDPDITTATDFYTESYTRKVARNTSMITLAPSVRYKLSSNLSVAGVLSLMSASDKEIDDVVASRVKGAAYTGARGGGLLNAVTQDDTLTQSVSPTGTGFGVEVSGAYKYGPKTTLRGVVSMASMPKSATGDYLVRRSTTTTAAGTGTSKLSSAITYKDDTATTGLIVGAENKISKDLTFGIGLRYLANSQTITWGTNLRSDDSAAGLVGYMQSDVTNKTDVTVYTLPVGLEYRMAPWIVARMGSAHTVTKTVAKVDTVLTTKSPAGVVQNVATTNSSASTTGAATAFSYGVGLDLTENLVVDVLANANLTNLAAWQIGVNLKF